MPDIVVVWNANRGSITHHIPKLHTKLKPSKGRLFVCIILTAGKEQQVRVMNLQVLNELCARKSLTISWRIAGHRRNDDNVLIDRIFADEAFETRKRSKP